MKIFNDTIGNRTRGFRLVAQCLNQLRYVMIHCIKGNKFIFFSATDINYRVQRASHYPLHNGRFLQVISSSLIPLRFILILSFNLRTFPPSGVFALDIPSKCLWSYFLFVLSATFFPLLVLITTKFVFKTPRHWLIFFPNFWMKSGCCIIKIQNLLRHFCLLKMRPLSSLENSETN